MRCAASLIVLFGFGCASAPKLTPCVEASQLLVRCPPRSQTGEVVVERFGRENRIAWRSGLTVIAAMHDASMDGGPIASGSSLVRTCLGGSSVEVHPWQIVGERDAFAAITTQPGDRILLIDW